jgi:hypothetical protein
MKRLTLGLEIELLISDGISTLGRRCIFDLSLNMNKGYEGVTRRNNPEPSGLRNGIILQENSLNPGG